MRVETWLNASSTLPFLDYINPAIFPSTFAVIGTARRPWSKEYFESVVVESILDLADSTEQAQEFASHFYYQSHDVNDTEHYIALRQLQAELNDKYQAEHNKLFFLSMAPQFFGTIAKHLKSESTCGR